jgi:hypothetical protein
MANFIRECVKDETAIFLLEEYGRVDDLPVNEEGETLLMEILWKRGSMVSYIRLLLNFNPHTSSSGTLKN